MVVSDNVVNPFCPHSFNKKFDFSTRYGTYARFTIQARRASKGHTKNVV